MSYRGLVLLGLGNPLFTDEGLGVHVVHALANRLPEEVTWVDGGTDGLGLLRIIEQAKYLLVVDAVDAGEEPGSIVVWSGEEIPKLQRSKLSQHQLGFQEVLALAEFNQKLPEKISLIGVQPHSLEWGCTLSPLVSSKLPQLLCRLNDVIRSWGLPELLGESVIADYCSDCLRENPLIGAGLRVVVEHGTPARVNSG